MNMNGTDGINLEYLLIERKKEDADLKAFRNRQNETAHMLRIRKEEDLRARRKQEDDSLRAARDLQNQNILQIYGEVNSDLYDVLAGILSENNAE